MGHDPTNLRRHELDGGPMAAPMSVRALLGSMAVVVYVTSFAVRDSKGPRPFALVLGALALGVLVVSFKRARGSQRVTVSSAAVVLASLGAPPGHTLATFFGDLAVASFVWVIESELRYVITGGSTPRGVAESLPRPRLGFLRLSALLWLALGAMVGLSARVGAFADLDFRRLTGLAVVLTIGALVVESTRVHLARALELGASERLGLFAFASALTMFVALGAGLASEVPPVRAFWIALAALALFAPAALRATLSPSRFPFNSRQIERAPGPHTRSVLTCRC